MSINNFIDLRSDTVTVPTNEMRAAMAQAEVGDDVLGEDPTINRLQEMAAARMGKEAGLFVSSGTMGNLIALLTHCGRGDEIIIGDSSHIFINEAGGSAAVGGIHPHIVPTQRDGTLRLEDVAAAIRSDDEHHPITRLIAIENTHNRSGGTVLTAEYTQQVADLAHGHGLVLHIDGARLFNAAVAMGIDVAALARAADSVTFCLSKGLGAPVGSVLCGSQAFIKTARRRRKMLGGGMRQAGILAAAGVYALDHRVDRLKEDHANARRLAEGIGRIPGLCVDMAAVQTNMVYFDLSDDLPFGAVELCRLAEAHGVKMFDVAPRTIRAVIHCWVSSAEIETTLQILSEVTKL